MWPYWLLFIIPAYFALTNNELNKKLSALKSYSRWTFRWKITFIILILMIGLRHQVGGDWNQYLDMLDSYVDNPASSNEFGFQDPAFILFNWLSAKTGLGIYLLNFLSAIFFCLGLVIFCRAQPRQWLALVVSVPYLITVVAMGYTRQGAAIGIAMIGMIALERGSILRFVLFIGFAALFHKSALILLPIAVLANTKKRIFTLLWVCLTGLILYFLMLQEAMTYLLSGYIEDAMQSSGAVIRVMMNALPAFIFIIFKRRFKLTLEQYMFWLCMSWSALALIIVLIISPSSTAVDRIALYWIPIQLFVLSRLPNALGKSYDSNHIWVIIIILYSATIHFVWLFYADTSYAWLPYKFYPYIWLWL